MDTLVKFKVKCSCEDLAVKMLKWLRLQLLKTKFGLSDQDRVIATFSPSLRQSEPAHPGQVPTNPLRNLT